MNNQYDDQKIAAEFDRLKQVERGYTPGFSSLLKNGSAGKHRLESLQPSFVFTLLVLLLTAWFVIGQRPENDNREAWYPADDIKLASIADLPTDFLLETPWPQLASLSDEMELLSPPYDFPEELTDEP